MASWRREKARFDMFRIRHVKAVDVITFCSSCVFGDSTIAEPCVLEQLASKVYLIWLSYQVLLMLVLHVAAQTSNHLCYYCTFCCSNLHDLSPLADCDGLSKRAVVASRTDKHIYVMCRLYNLWSCGTSGAGGVLWRLNYA